MHSSYPALVAGILWTETGSMTSMDRETKRRPSGVAWAPAARCGRAGRVDAGFAGSLCGDPAGQEKVVSGRVPSLDLAG